MKESAQNVVKMKEAVKLLADKLDLEPTEEEYQKAMARYAAMARHDRCGGIYGISGRGSPERCNPSGCCDAVSG